MKTLIQGVALFLMFVAIKYMFINESGLSQSEAAVACMNAINKEVIHPSTVKFKSIGFKADKDQKGYWSIAQPFNAKNSFNLEIEFTGFCAVSSSGTVVATVAEN